MSVAGVNARIEQEPSRLRVAFVGEAAPDAPTEGWELVSAESEADVYHVRHDRLDAISDLRARRVGAAAVVADLRAIRVDGLDRRTLALARQADLVVVSSEHNAKTIAQRDGRLADRLSVMRAPIDLERFAPDAELAATRRVQFSRFKRYHRLAPPTVMFAGPYAPGLGFDVALDAVYELRDELEEIRLTSLPFGGVDHRFLDRCERRALVLGHRGIVQWEGPTEEELPFWFATASVVLVAGIEADRLVLLAAAAARPVVRLEPVKLDPAPSPGLMAAGALAAAIRELLGPAGVAAGEAARSEIVASQKTNGRRLAELWSSAAAHAGALSNASFRAVREDRTSVPSSSTVIQPR